MPDSDAWYVHALLEEEIRRGGFRPNAEEPVELALPDGRRLFYLTTSKPEQADDAASEATQESGDVVNVAGGFTIRALLTEDRTTLATEAMDRLASCVEASMLPLDRPVPPVAAGGQAVYVRVWLPDDGCIPLRPADIDNHLAARIASQVEMLERTGRLDNRPGRPVRLEAAGLPGTFYYACWERSDPNSEHRKYNEVRVVRVAAATVPWAGDIARLLASIRVPTSREEIERGGWKSVQAVDAQVPAGNGKEPARPVNAIQGGRATAEIDTTGPAKKAPRILLWVVGFAVLAAVIGAVLIWWPKGPGDAEGKPGDGRKPGKETKDSAIPDSVAQDWEKFHRGLGDWLASTAADHRPDDLMKRLVERTQRPDLMASVRWGSNQKALFTDYMKNPPEQKNLFLDFVNRLPQPDPTRKVGTWREGTSRAAYYRAEVAQLVKALETSQKAVHLPDGARKDWSVQRLDDPEPLFSDLKEYLTFEPYFQRMKGDPAYKAHSMKSDGFYEWQRAVKQYLLDNYR